MEYGFEYAEGCSVAIYNRHIESSRDKPSWSERAKKLLGRTRSLFRKARRIDVFAYIDGEKRIPVDVLPYLR